MPARVKNVVETLAFVNPTIIKKDGTRVKGQRGWQITTSKKYPVDKFNKMLVDLAESNGGQAKLMMEVSINLNQTSDEPLDAAGIELIS